MASSTTKQLVFQLNEALLKEQRTENDDSSDERILDIINRLDKIENIDNEILEETRIGITVSRFRKNYSEAISSRARLLRKKWMKMHEDAKQRATSASTNQNNVEEMKVSSNNNDMEIDNDDSRDTSNESDSNDKEGNLKTSDDEDGIDNSSTTNEQQDTQAGNTNTKMSCDICSKEANFRADIGQLQRCKGCGIYVHELCYCLVPTKKLDPNFTCHACKAVGTTVEVNVPSRIGVTGDKREQMTVDERPMECALCSHNRDNEYHAMHPLYDTHGKEGRQYVLKATRSGIGGKPRRLAWVHTLCAQMLCVTKDYLFGVVDDDDYEDDNGSAQDSASDEEATAEGDESDSDEEVGGQKYKIGTKVYKEFRDDDTGQLRFFKGKVVRFDKRRKYYKIIYTDGDSEDMTESEVKEHLQRPAPVAEKDAATVSVTGEAGNQDTFMATRNFCINVEDKREDITFSRQNLKCAICNLDDTNSTRIVTQCNAGDDGVDEDLTQYYSDAMREKECRSAMHVGCELIFLLCFV